MTRTRSWLSIGCLSLAFAFPLAVRAADDAKPERPGAARTGEGAGNLLKNVRAKVDELNLSSDQKTKIDEIFTNAETDLKRAFADAQNMQPDERRQKYTEFMSGLKEKINGVLTDDQKAKFAEQAALPAAGGNRPGAGAGGARQGQMGERFKEALEKLDLTADQKEKIKPIMEEFKQKLEGLRGDAQSGDREKGREKAMAAMKEMREKLNGVLTPEQQEKFRQSFAGAGGARRGQNNNGGGDKPKSDSSSSSSDSNK